MSYHSGGSGGGGGGSGGGGSGGGGSSGGGNGTSSNSSGSENTVGILSFENIDIEKMGYRYRGPYSTSLTYYDNDVVYKDGGAYFYKKSTNTFSEFLLGQSRTNQTGSVVGYDQNVKGVRGEVLFLDSSGAFKFRDPLRRNTARVKAFPRNLLYREGTGYLSRQSGMSFLMEDGTIRHIGQLLLQNY